MLKLYWFFKFKGSFFISHRAPKFLETALPPSSVPAPARYHLALASSSAARHFGRHDQDCARSTLTAVHRNGPGRNRQHAGANASPLGLACYICKGQILA